MVEIILFLVLSAFLVILTRRSLTSLRSHGLYRLISWMGILGLFFLVWRHWFEKPFALNQIISWAFLFFALVYVIAGGFSLRSAGGTNESRTDDSLLGFEKTSKLVTDGIYRYIRHPMYASLIFLGLGIYLKWMTTLTTSIMLEVLIFIHLTAIVEEMENIKYFGKDYVDFIGRTKRFIPFVW